MDGSSYSAKNLVKHSIVQSFFVLEVVIDQCLIYPCQACDCVGAGPGNALARELTNCGFENGGAAFF